MHLKKLFIQSNMLSTVAFKRFLEEGEKLEHSVKSALGRINKTIQQVDEFIENFSLYE